jgi:hypothetical protein
MDATLEAPMTVPSRISAVFHMDITSDDHGGFQLGHETERFPDSVEITADDAKITIAPSFEAGVFDSLEIDRDGTVRARALGFLPRFVEQKQLRDDARGILQRALVDADAVMAPKLRAALTAISPFHQQYVETALSHGYERSLWPSDWQTQ